MSKYNRIYRDHRYYDDDNIGMGYYQTRHTHNIARDHALRENALYNKNKRLALQLESAYHRMPYSAKKQYRDKYRQAYTFREDNNYISKRENNTKHKYSQYNQLKRGIQRRRNIFWMPEGSVAKLQVQIREGQGREAAARNLAHFQEDQQWLKFRREIV